jgi:hypothetical protein
MDFSPGDVRSESLDITGVVGMQTTTEPACLLQLSSGAEVHAAFVGRGKRCA